MTDQYAGKILTAEEIAGVTELRLHGVGGTRPESLLDDPHLRLVSGDKDAGFYRPARRQEEWPKWRHREALSWGGLTSGSALRALWLLLLPFTLINLAGWMHPPGTNGANLEARANPGTVKGLIRLIALTATMMATLAITTIFFELVAYQCGNFEVCREQYWWMSPFGWPWLADQPIRRLAVAALAPLVFVWLLWWASHRSFMKLEGFDLSPEYKADPSIRDPSLDLALTHEDFWRGEVPVGRLRRLHTTAGLVTVAVALAWSVRSLDAVATEVGMQVAMSETLGVVIAILGVGLLLVTVFQTFTPRPVGALWSWAAYVLLGVSVMYAAWSRPVWWTGNLVRLPTSRIRDLDQIVGALGGLQVLLLLVLGVALLRSRRRIDQERECCPPIEQKVPEQLLGPALFGLGPLIICTLALLLLTSVWAGAGIRTADALGCPLPDDARGCRQAINPTTGRAVMPPVNPDEAEVRLRYPFWYQLAALAFLVFVLAAVVLAAVEYIGYRRRGQAPGRLKEVKDDFGLSDSEYRQQERRVHSIARSYELSNVVRRADTPLAFAVAIGVLAAGVLSVFAIYKLMNSEPNVLPVFPRWLVTAATWLIALIPTLALTLLLGAVRTASLRRSVGIIWDVITFWPRHQHPFAAPCYGERVVPQLSGRLQRLTVDAPTAGNGRVLVLAHSQGSVIAVAALLQMVDKRPVTEHRVALFTYGSPLTLLYRRMFPAYFGGGVLTDLARCLNPTGKASWPHWRHFYCRTDPLGVKMFDRQPDCPPKDGQNFVQEERLNDPHEFRTVHGEPPLAMARHSAYLHHPDMQHCVTETLKNLNTDLESNR